MNLFNDLMSQFFNERIPAPNKSRDYNPWLGFAIAALEGNHLEVFDSILPKILPLTTNEWLNIIIGATKSNNPDLFEYISSLIPKEQYDEILESRKAFILR